MIPAEALATLQRHAERLLAAMELVQLAAIVVALDILDEAPPWAREHRGRVLQEEHGPQRVRFYEQHPDAARRGLEEMVVRAPGEIATALRALVSALWSWEAKRGAVAGGQGSLS